MIKGMYNTSYRLKMLEQLLEVCIKFIQQEQLIEKNQWGKK